MMRSKKTFGALLVSTLLLGASACGSGGSSGGSSSGGNYPSGPIEIIAPADPGSGFDTMARAIAEAGKSEDLVDAPMTVQNRPGGLGVSAVTAMVENAKGKDNQIQIGS